jgi:hypothetical protein
MKLATHHQVSIKPGEGSLTPSMKNALSA